MPDQCVDRNLCMMGGINTADFGCTRQEFMSIADILFKEGRIYGYSGVMILRDLILHEFA